MATLLIGLFLAAYLYREANPPRHWDFESLYETQPEGAKRVLWVGNSHMWLWEHPRRLQQMIPDGEPKHWWELVAEPGVTSSYHLESGPAVSMASGDWDVILLQPQSVEPAASPSYWAESVAKWELIARENGKKLVIWVPWGRDPTNDSYQIYERSWSGGSLEELTRRMAVNTEEAATDAVVCPLGEAWLLAYERHPKAPLWGHDGNHSTLVSTYLNTALLYACIWGGDPRTITHVPKGLSPENAEKLRLIAWDMAVQKGILEGEPGTPEGSESERQDLEGELDDE